MQTDLQTNLYHRNHGDSSLYYWEQIGTNVEDGTGRHVRVPRGTMI